MLFLKSLASLRFRAGTFTRHLVFPAAACWGVFMGALSTARGLDPGQALTQYATKHWGAEDGLPFENILCVTQDHTGYLWLGTKEGLVRFDGVRAQTFDGRTDQALGGYGLFSVLEDARSPDRLILANTNGIHYFADDRTQVSLPNVPAGKILLQDPLDGALWIKTARGLFHVASSGTVTGPLENASGWPIEAVQTICRGKSGTLWVGTDRGLYRQRHLNKDTGWFDRLPVLAGEGVDQLVPSRDGGLWVGSRDAGIGRLGENDEFHPRLVLAGSQVNAMLEDRTGTLWVGTSGRGLCRITVGDHPRTEVHTTKTGLISDEVTGLCEDREGNLWVGTPKGLQVLQDTLFVNFGQPEGMSGDEVHTVFEDGQGSLWVGHEHGLSRINVASNEVVNCPLTVADRRPGSDAVLCVGPAAGDGSLLAGTRAGLLIWHQGSLAPFPVREDLDRSVVSALCSDAGGNHWVGTDNGLYRLQDNQVLTHLNTATGLVNGHVGALHLDTSGTLWIGTDGGLNRLEVDGQIVEVVCSTTRKSLGAVYSFYEEPKELDGFFIGTQEGLYRLHHAKNDGEPRLTRYQALDGSLDGAICGIVADDQGNLWLSSSKGIVQVAKADLEQFDRVGSPLQCKVYGTADGLRSRVSASGSQPVSCRDPRGRLWFATARSAAYVTPARFLAHRQFPPVQIEELLVDGRVENIGHGKEGVAFRELAAGTRKLGFRYTGLSLAAPEACRFRYRLDGFDAGWNEAGMERVAYYTNLPPGRYIFRVQATNRDGVWTRVDAGLAFGLSPFFYQTGWFQCLVAAVGIGSVWGTVYGWRRRWKRRLTRTETDLRERTRQQAVINQAKEDAELARANAEQAKEQAEAARAIAEQANKAKSEFLSRISHELRTPLNAILGFGQLLEISDLSAEDRASVGYLLKGGRHLLGLIDEVLDLARAESGDLNLVCGKVDLHALAHGCIQLVGRLAQARKVECLVQMSSAVTTIWSDEQRLRQVLFNLLSNAIKYNQEGGSVVLSSELVSPGKLRIKISDTGLGIPPEGLAKLFVPFERLDQAYGEVQGTGLGLVISRRLVEAMGGTLGVESQPGHGSTFWIELAVPAEQLHTPEEVLPPAIPAAIVSPTKQQAKLLYIDDSLSNLKVVEMLIRSRRPNWQFSSAQDGNQGLEQARRILPDLILLDLQLPGMSGEVVLAALRQHPATRFIPVIMISADATAQSQERLLAGGADGYITKPFELNALTALLDRPLTRTTVPAENE